MRIILQTKPKLVRGLEVLVRTKMLDITRGRFTEVSPGTFAVHGVLFLKEDIFTMYWNGDDVEVMLHGLPEDYLPEMKR